MSLSLPVFPSLSRRIRSATLILIFIFWTRACIADAPVLPDTENIQSAESRTCGQEGCDTLPPLALTSQILFRVLAAEIALQRHLFAPAYQTYLALARETHDPRMAQRAAEIALYAQSLSDALTAVRMWRHEAPHSRRAARFEARILILSGHLDEAQPILATELADVPEEQRGAEILALKSLIAKHTDPRQGLRTLRSLLKDEMERTETHLALARQQLLAQQPAQAQRSLERALALEPDNEVVALLLGQLGPAQRQQAIRALLTAIEQNPAAHKARLALAQLYLSDQQIEHALRQFQALYAQNPNDLAALMGLAQAYMEQKRLDAAEKYLYRYLQASKPEDDTGQAYLYLAFIAAEKNDTAQAMQWLGHIRPASNWYIPAWLARTQLLAQAGKIDEAHALLSRLKSSDPQTQVLIARIDSALLLDAQRTIEAEERLAQAYQEWPDAPELIYDYAMAAERNRHYAQMETLLRRLIDLRPHDPDAYNALGYSLADRGQQLHEAKRWVEKAAQLAPDNPYILDSLGWVEYRLGNIEKAAALLQRAYQIEPHAEIGAHLGEVLWKQDRQQEARQIWREAQRIEPDNATLRETMQRFLGQP